MKKVIFIHGYSDRSGAPKVLRDIVQIFLKKGFRYELYSGDSKQIGSFLDEIKEHHTHYLFNRSDNKIITLMHYILSQTVLFFILLKNHRKEKDTIFYVNAMMPFGAALAAKLMGIEVIYHIHETSVRPKVLKQFLRTMIYLTASKVIFVSEYLKKVECFKNKKQIVVHNALAMHTTSIEKKTDQKFNVLMVCSLKKYKGILEFIKLADFMNSNNLHFTLVLNASKKEVSDFFMDILLPSNITLCERQTNLSEFYENSDILLNLSRPDGWIETFGLTILEGMAFGLPVIVPPIGGPVEIVRENVEGFLISCYEIEKLAEAINFLKNDKSEYNRLSKNSRDRIKSFNIDDFEERILHTIFENTKDEKGKR